MVDKKRVSFLGTEMGKTMTLKPQTEASAIWSAIDDPELKQEVQRIFYEAAEKAREEVLAKREGK